MKKILCLLPAIALLFLLGGCVGHDLDATIAHGAKQLSASQLRELVNGSTVQLAGFGQQATVEFSGDGTMSGKNTAGEKDKGRWQVRKDELCIHFKKWVQGDARCYRVAASGDTYQLFSRKGMMIYDLTVITPGLPDTPMIPLTQPATPAYHGSTAQQPSASPMPQEQQREEVPVTRQTVEDVRYILRQNAQNCPGCNLAHAQLSGQRLMGANLQGANLTEADLSHANLRRANLRGANLYRANLQGADLAGADLTGANLSEAIR